MNVEPDRFFRPNVHKSMPNSPAKKVHDIFTPAEETPRKIRDWQKSKVFDLSDGNSPEKPRYLSPFRCEDTKDRLFGLDTSPRKCRITDTHRSHVFDAFSAKSNSNGHAASNSEPPKRKFYTRNPITGDVIPPSSATSHEPSCVMNGYHSKTNGHMANGYANGYANGHANGH